MRVHIVAAAHRRLDATAAGGALRRGDDGTVVLGHAAGHQIGTAAAAGQAADRHAAIVAVVVGHAGTTAGWGLGVSRAAQRDDGHGGGQRRRGDAEDRTKSYIYPETFRQKWF